MSKHPALQMSKARKQAWLDHAEPEDFFEMITLLSQLYAKKIYTPKSGYHGDSLLESYPEYLKGKLQRDADKDFTNNVPAMTTLAVPFASKSDAPGSVVEEPVDSTEQTLQELMAL